MTSEEVEQAAIALIDEFSANVAGRSLLLAADSPIDELVIRAVAMDGLVKLRENANSDVYSLVFGEAIALGAFLQHKGRFDIMKLRGTIQ